LPNIRLGKEMGGAAQCDYCALTVGADHDSDGAVGAVACEGDRDADVQSVMAKSVAGDKPVDAWDGPKLDKTIAQKTIDALNFYFVPQAKYFFQALQSGRL
jgi:hypothetical protein